MTDQKEKIRYHRPGMVGEHHRGDAGQLILLILFLAVWITDAFIWHYSTFLNRVVPLYIRIPAAVIVMVAGFYLAKVGMRIVFGTEREKPELITNSVFRIVRHPIYLGAILFYPGMLLLSISLSATAIWIVIIVFYYFLSRFEEKLLIATFGDAYLEYIKRVPMLFPRPRIY